WEKSAARICAAGSPSGKIGSADFLTNMGWTLGCPGQAGNIVKELRWRSRGCSATAGSVGIGSADEIGRGGRIGSRC
ncbi:hypothetical protein, partial [Escherichia sp. R19]|uniref:hypothetical protein n=1 Tax=Escherichia sp. R19 TaxID=2082633 RepID=UPI001F1B6DCE